jgi:hypothetical protein
MWQAGSSDCWNKPHIFRKQNSCRIKKINWNRVYIGTFRKISLFWFTSHFQFK